MRLGGGGCSVPSVPSVPSAEAVAEELYTQLERIEELRPGTAKRLKERRCRKLNRDLSSFCVSGVGVRHGESKKHRESKRGST